jgi:ParB/RepB/Spo0J family partition protein
MAEKRVGIQPRAVGSIVVIPWKSIRPFRDQPRKYFDKEELENLADSIQEIGQQTPIWVRVLADDPLYDYELIDGERRYIACGMRKIPEMIAQIRTTKSQADQFVQAVVANFGRSGHTSLETARAIERIRKDRFGDNIEFGDKIAEKLAKIFARSTAWVHQYRSLLRLHPDVQAMMEADVPKEQRLKFQIGISLANLRQEIQLPIAKHVISHGFRLKRALSYIRSKSEGMRVSNKGSRQRKPVDNYKILSRFLHNLGEEAEALLDMSHATFEDMFRYRPVKELLTVVEVLKQRREQLETLSQVVARVAGVKNGRPTLASKQQAAR